MRSYFFGNCGSPYLEMKIRFKFIKQIVGYYKILNIFTIQEMSPYFSPNISSVTNHAYVFLEPWLVCEGLRNKKTGNTGWNIAAYQTQNYYYFIFIVILEW
jgi:hypothetical protein